MLSPDDLKTMRASVAYRVLIASLYCAALALCGFLLCWAVADRIGKNPVLMGVGLGFVLLIFFSVLTYFLASVTVTVALGIRRRSAMPDRMAQKQFNQALVEDLAHPVTALRRRR